MAGVDVVSVKEILGHRDIETTMRYSHLSPAHLKEDVNKGSLGAAVLHTVASTVADHVWLAAETVQPLDLLVRPEGLEPPTLGSEVAKMPIETESDAE